MQAFYLRVSLTVHILHKTLDRDVHLISRFLEKVTLCCHHETHGRSCVPASNLWGGADVHSTRLSVITYTNPPNKGHTRNHSFTSSHLQSHLQPRSVTHTHFCLTLINSQFLLSHFLVSNRRHHKQLSSPPCLCASRLAVYYMWLN